MKPRALREARSKAPRGARDPYPYILGAGRGHRTLDEIAAKIGSLTAALRQASDAHLRRVSGSRKPARRGD